MSTHPPFRLDQADYYILADIDLSTGRTVYEQVQITFPYIKSTIGFYDKK